MRTTKQTVKPAYSVFRSATENAEEAAEAEAQQCRKRPRLRHVQMRSLSGPFLAAPFEGGGRSCGCERGEIFDASFSLNKPRCGCGFFGQRALLETD